MTPDLDSVQKTVNTIEQIVVQPFYGRVEFWIGFLLGASGLVFSFLAFIEAKKARRAAVAAGQTVKIQTITIELSEILQVFDRVNPEIKYSEARDLHSLISRRLRRMVSPYSKDHDLKDAIQLTLNTLDTLKEALTKVRPTNMADEVPGATYNGVEAEFSSIGSTIASLLGLFEQKTLPHGASNAQ